MYVKPGYCNHCARRRDKHMAITRIVVGTYKETVSTETKLNNNIDAITNRNSFTRVVTNVDTIFIAMQCHRLYSNISYICTYVTLALMCTLIMISVLLLAILMNLINNSNDIIMQ